MNFYSEQKKTYFESECTLGFQSLEIENEYQQMMNPQRSKCGKVIVILLIIFHCLNVSIFSFFTKFGVRCKANILNSILLFINIILLVINFIKLEKIFYFKLYLNHILLGVSLVSFRINTKIFFDFDQIYVDLINGITIIIKLFDLLVIDLNFKRNILSQIAIEIFSLIIMGSYSNLVPNEILNEFIFLFIQFFGYFSEKLKKLSFISDYSSKKSTSYFLNLINQLKNGYAIFTKEKIVFSNDFFKTIEFLCLNEYPSKVNENKVLGRSSTKGVNIEILQTEINLMDSKSVNENLLFLEKLFTQMKIVSDLIPKENRVLFKTQSSIEKLFEIFEKNSNSFLEFTYIGNKVINDKPENYFEVEIFLRVVSKERCNHFEIVLNDISRTKIFEESQAKEWYKSIFLSKVAHEMKNPLISINELTQQVNEYLVENRNIFCSKNQSSLNVESIIGIKKKRSNILKNSHADTHDHTNKISSNIKETKKKIKLIQNLVSYLINIIHDFNFLSLGNNLYEQIGKINKNEKQVSLKKLARFCIDIAKTNLEFKNNSKLINHIEIMFEIDKKLPEVIIVDEVKIKQILINLLLNSVKFTNSGTIKLSMKKIENNQETKEKVKFVISDTGIGLDKLVKERLFSEFNKSLKMNNTYGSGLGLSISSDLAKQIGYGLNFKSNSKKFTTKFYFEINLKPSYDFKFSSDTDDKEFVVDLNIHTSENHSRTNSLFDSSKVSQIDSQNETKILNRLDSFAEIYDQNPKESSNKLVPKIGIKTSLFRPKKDFIEDISKRSNGSSFEGNQVFVQSHYSNSNRNVFSENHEEKFLRILFVDDESLVRKSTMRIFGKYLETKLNSNYEFLEAEDGIECLYTIYTLNSQNKKIDYILMDETMRYMNGSNCAEVLQGLFLSKMTNSIPIYIVTAYEHNTDELNNHNKFIQGIISKPVDFSKIQIILQNNKFFKN